MVLECSILVEVVVSEVVVALVKALSAKEAVETLEPVYFPDLAYFHSMFSSLPVAFEALFVPLVMTLIELLIR